MALERGAFAFGAATYPLTTSTTNDLLSDVDPALASALQFLAATFETYFGARLIAQAKLHGLKLPAAVVTKAGIEPAPVLLADQFQFPIFCLYRKRDTYDETSISYDKSISTWEFAYVLPPLTPLQGKEIQPILRAASVTLRRAIHLGYDPAYRSGAPVWAEAGVLKARLVDATYGGFERIDQLDRFYRALSGTIVVWEREGQVPSAYDMFDGADVTGAEGAIDLKVPGEPAVENFVEIETHVAPTVTSVAPTTGTAAGGTAVTITGTGFRVGTRPIVLFDGAAADAVTVVNATTITCVTPPHAAYPSALVDLVLVGSDGQTDTLADAFTFTA